MAPTAAVPSPRQCGHRTSRSNIGSRYTRLRPAWRRPMLQPRHLASLSLPANTRPPSRWRRSVSPPARTVARSLSSPRPGARARVRGAGQHHRAGLAPCRGPPSGYRPVTAGYDAGLVFTQGIANLGQSTYSFRSRMGWDGVKLGRRGSVGPTACPGQVVAVRRAPGQPRWFSALVVAARSSTAAAGAAGSGS